MEIRVSLLLSSEAFENISLEYGCAYKLYALRGGDCALAFRKRTENVLKIRQIFLPLGKFGTFPLLKKVKNVGFYVLVVCISATYKFCCRRLYSIRIRIKTHHKTNRVTIL